MIKGIQMNNKLKKILKYSASAAFALLLLWFSFRGVDWKEFGESLQECRWEYMILSMSAGSIAFWVRALRWRRLLLPIDPSITRTTAFNGVNIGNVSNFVFPRIGEFVRCGVISRRSQPVDPSEPDNKKASYERVLGTVVLERGWELVVMLMLLVVVVIAGFNRYGTFVMEKVIEPMGQKYNISLWWVAAAAVALLGGLLYLLWRLRGSNAFCRKVWGVFRGIGQGFTSCFAMEHKWLFFAYTLLVWVLYWLMAACSMWAAPFLDSLNMFDALFLSLVGGLGFAVPVPGGIGAFHYIIAMALVVVYGVPYETGLLYATLSHTSQAVTQIAFGAGSYIYEALKK